MTKRSPVERGSTDYGAYLDAQRVHLAAEQSLIDMTARRSTELRHSAIGLGISGNAPRARPAFATFNH